MTKRAIGSVVAVFMAYSILDFILHGLLLRSTYEATANLWRPMDQMKMPLMYFVTLVFAVCFVMIYGSFIERKSLASGIRFGVLLGLAVGVPMGFGSYSYMPIPLALAWSWFLGSWIEATIAGAIVGAMMKPEGQ
jgi:Na+/H+ antiporter NhaA